MGPHYVLKKLNLAIITTQWAQSTLQNCHDFLQALGEIEIFQTINGHYENIIAKLRAEMKKQPIGYRYTGKFYIKGGDSAADDYTLIDGSLFMRQDLISWQIENCPEHAHQRPRDAYKSIAPIVKITREDTVAVFEKTN